MTATNPARPGRRPDPALRTLWQQRLLRFQRSGLTPAAFCASEGVSLPSFYSWRRRLTGQTTLDTIDLHDNDTALPRLVPVRLLASPAPVELLLPSGAVLRLSPGCDLAFVRSLLDALEGPPC